MEEVVIWYVYKYIMFNFHYLSRPSQCAHNCPEPNLRAQVHEAGAALAQALLAEAALLGGRAHTQHVYERMRREVIQPFSKLQYLYFYSQR